MKALVAALYLLLMRHFSEDKKIAEKKQLSEFYKIVNYVNSHFKENINIKTIAAALYMSREKVSSVFNRYSNLQLNDYIDKLRINNANNLILEGYAITASAFESGFQSIRTFNNTYKKITGMTPREYKQKH